MQLTRSFTIDSLGACQGISWLHNKAYLYGDREVGMIREFELRGDSLSYTGHECRLTIDDTDVINHPTGLAIQTKTLSLWQQRHPRQSDKSMEGDHLLYRLARADENGDAGWRNLLQVIEDDACIQGTRPEYVEYDHKWYVRTADYGNRANEGAAI